MGTTATDPPLSAGSLSASSSRSSSRPAEPPAAGSHNAPMPLPAAAVSVQQGNGPAPDSKGKGKAPAGAAGQATTDKGAAAGPGDDAPRPKKRRRRAALNCQECRRLKLKCSREVPCDQCIKRGCGDTCPDGKASQGPKPDPAALQKRIAELEALLRARPAASPAPAPVFHSVSPATAPAASSIASGPVFAAQNAAPLSAMSSPDEDEEVEGEGSLGTLIVDESGRHKWVGPRAGSEWLREDGVGEDGMATPFPGTHGAGAADGAERGKQPGGLTFPFAGGPPALKLDECLAKVPSRSEARALIEAYYRYSSYNYDPIRRSSFDEHVNAIYAAVAARSAGKPVDIDPQRLALFFQILATGCQSSLEFSPSDPISDFYHGLAQCCLALGQFMQKPTLAACQALHVMGHYVLTKNPQSGGERAWPIWGIAMRCCIAMGLHRDGSKWELEPKVNDERRLVFWESQTADLLQSACYSRPNTLSIGTYDTLFPVDADAVEAGVEIGFSTLKFRLATLINGHLSQLMKINPPTSYGTVTRLWHAIFNFEENLPFYWRCRPAWEALISISGSPEEAVKTSPATDKHDLRLTAQRHVLALNIADAVLFLQRPYFTKALNESPLDPCQSKYASSFLAVFERCLVTIRINQSMSALYPAFTQRQWFFWYHTFTAAVCMSTITILAPKCPFATFALLELEAIVLLFSSATEGSRPRSTLPSLIKFLERAKDRMAAEAGDAQPSSGGSHFPAMANMFGAPAPGADVVDEARKEEDQDHLALLGWTTRLVKSLKGKKRRGISISHLVDAGNGEPSVSFSLDPPASGAAPPISDTDLASLSNSMSWFSSALPADATGRAGAGVQEGAAGSFPLPTDLGSTSSLSPTDPKDAFDYNSIAQFTGFMPSLHEMYDNIGWDGTLADQFMLGSSSMAPPPDDQHPAPF